MGRSSTRRKVSTPGEQKRAALFSNQLFVWRYCENHWWQMTEGFEFRGLVPVNRQAAAHNMALYARCHWHVYSITYLKDNNGKRYREFSYHRTQQQITGVHDGVSFLMKQAMDAGEATVNTKHIYGRAMVFAPWSKAYPSLVPLLKRKMAQLRLTDNDVEEMAKHETDISANKLRLVGLPEPKKAPELTLDQKLEIALKFTEKSLMTDINKTYENSTITLKALNHPVRLSVLKQLRNGNASNPTDMMAFATKELGIEIGQSSMSQHLRVLKEAGMVTSVRQQNTVHYKRSDDTLNYLVQLLNEIQE